MRIPANIKHLLDDLAQEFKHILGNNFVGFYVHGSIAMNCFNPEKSDIDFLVVVNSAIESKAKRKIIEFLVDKSSGVTAQGFEMSIIKQSELEHFKYPTPFELHFHFDHLEKLRKDPGYICEDGVDYDLAAHLTITKERGICILGRDIKEVIPLIPKEYYLDSIIRDSKWSLDRIFSGPDEGLCEVPHYATLNFCRVLAFVNDGLITSKYEGGQWGIKNLPSAYKFLIQQALNKYSSSKTEKFECKALKEFAKYSEAIFQKVNKI